MNKKGGEDEEEQHNWTVSRAKEGNQVEGEGKGMERNSTLMKRERGGERRERRMKGSEER